MGKLWKPTSEHNGENDEKWREKYDKIILSAVIKYILSELSLK